MSLKKLDSPHLFSVCGKWHFFAFVIYIFVWTIPLRATFITQSDCQNKLKTQLMEHGFHSTLLSTRMSAQKLTPKSMHAKVNSPHLNHWALSVNIKLTCPNKLGHSSWDYSPLLPLIQHQPISSLDCVLCKYLSPSPQTQDIPALWISWVWSQAAYLRVFFSRYTSQFIALKTWVTL